MKFKTLMIIKAIVCLVFGPLLILAPGALMTLLGATWASGAAEFTARAYGASLVGNLLLAWLARGVQDSPARRAIVWDLFVYDAIGLVSGLIFQLGGGFNLLGWGIVFVYAFLTVGFGYFVLKPKAE